jgi:hypothetical protein
VAGRKPVGPALAERVSGSEQALARLKVVLETITGDKTMEEACQALGLHKTRLFELRLEALQAAAVALEPAPLGRPPQVAGPEAARVAQLEQRIDELEVELEAARLRVELAQTLPALSKEALGAKKKSRRLRRRRNR